jgi:hypothetical protein
MLVKPNSSLDVGELPHGQELGMKNREDPGKKSSVAPTPLELSPKSGVSGKREAFNFRVGGQGTLI